MKLPVTEIDLMGTYTVRETADILQLTDDKVYDLIRSGELPFVKLGRQYRIGRMRLWVIVNALEDASSIEEVFRGALHGNNVERGDAANQEPQ